jgi:4-diphosphocytidyl-2-C-methyl-D-erythritol kinase
VKRGSAAAKINLALVVGPIREDGKHELTTVYQRITLTDRIEVRRAEGVSVEGCADDTLVRSALERLADATGAAFGARIEKRIPVAAGLGGGSADAAAALRLANAELDNPLSRERLDEMAASIGADVPFLLRDGPHVGSGDGTQLAPIDLPQDYWILLALPNDARKTSTGDIYAEYDARDGADGYEDRRAELLASLERVRRPRDLAALPANDLASSPLSEELRDLGAFRADVTGAGPTVYGLFLHRAQASAAERALKPGARTWLTAPAWYV